MAEMMRLPSVVVVQQRGGPSTATVIYSQQEVNLTCYGGNGEGLRVVYSTSSHQDLFDYTIKAFNTAWKYRFPTFILGDGYQAKMRESVTLYDPASRGVDMMPTEPFLGKSGYPGVDRPPTHIRNTYNTEEELYEVMQNHARSYELAAPEIIEYEVLDAGNADLVLVAHGVVSRAAREAYRQLKSYGYRIGYFRPITLSPFPSRQLTAVATGTTKLLVVESSLGQLYKMVRDALYGVTTPIETLLKPGVGVTPEEIVQAALRILA